MRLRSKLIFITGIILIILVGYGVIQQQPTTPKSIQNAEPSIDAAPTTFKLYFPYDTGSDFALREVTAIVHLKASETPLERLAELLKQPSPTNSNEQLVPVLGPNAEILSIEVLDNQTIKVNVNQEFITQMNAGASLERAILRAFIKSIATLYDATGILLQVNGAAYESGHYFFDKNNVININDSL